MSFGFGSALQKDHGLWQEAVPKIKERGLRSFGLRSEHVQGFRTEDSEKVAKTFMRVIEKRKGDFKEAFERAVQAKIKSGGLNLGKSLEETVFEVLQDVLTRTYLQARYKGSQLKHEGRDLFTTQRGFAKAQEVAIAITKSLFEGKQEELKNDLNTILKKHKISATEHGKKALDLVGQKVKELAEKAKRERDAYFLEEEVLYHGTKTPVLDPVTGKPIKKIKAKWSELWGDFSSKLVPCNDIINLLSSEGRRSHRVKVDSGAKAKLTHPEDQFADQTLPVIEESDSKPVAKRYLAHISESARMKEESQEAQRFARSQAVRGEIQAGSQSLAFSRSWAELEGALMSAANEVCLRSKTQEMLDVVKDLAEEVSGQEIDAAIAFEKKLHELSELNEDKQIIKKINQDPTLATTLKGGLEFITQLKEDAPKLINVVTAIRARLSKFPKIADPEDRLYQALQKYSLLKEGSKEKNKLGVEIARLYFLISLMGIKIGLESRANNIAKHLESHGLFFQSSPLALSKAQESMAPQPLFHEVEASKAEITSRQRDLAMAAAAMANRLKSRNSDSEGDNSPPSR